MADDAINQNVHVRVVMSTATMAWTPSPSPKVKRKRLELTGPAEAGRVTSLVRYDAGSTFAPHQHPDGEEILVLSGELADDHGTYPAGTYLLNPDGSAHAPRSGPGCDLLVKLRQYPGTDRTQYCVDTRAMDWQPGAVAGVAVKPLYQEDGYRERMRLVRYDPGVQFPDHDHPGGEEVFVIEGDLADQYGTYQAGTWLRMPPGSCHAPYSASGCLLYVKVGHL